MSVQSDGASAQRVARPPTTGPMSHAGVGNRVTGETAVYRLRDASGRLWYVGMSRNPMSRWACHADVHPWWGEIATFAVEWFASRDEAARAEEAAIRKEKPLGNTQCTPRHGLAVMDGVHRSFRREEQRMNELARRASNA